MARWHRFELAIAACCLAMVILPSCRGDDDSSPIYCAPGQQIRCACSATLDGIQSCKSDGSGYEACVCTDAGARDASVDASLGTGGAGGTRTGSSGGAAGASGGAAGAGGGVGGNASATGGATSGAGGAADASGGAGATSGPGGNSSGGAAGVGGNGGGIDASGGTAGSGGGLGGAAGSFDSGASDVEAISCSDASVGPPGAVKCGQTTCYTGVGSSNHCCTSQMGFCSTAGCSQFSPPWAMEFCDGPEDCSYSAGAVCRFSFPNVGCNVLPSTRYEAAANPVVCHADCDCPAISPYCGGGDQFRGVRFFGSYCLVPCTTYQDCPVVNMLEIPRCYGSDPGVCVYSM